MKQMNRKRMIDLEKETTQQTINILFESYLQTLRKWLSSTYVLVLVSACGVNHEKHKHDHT